MYIEQLTQQTDKKAYLESMTDSDKAALLQEIENKKKEAETKKIQLETKKTSLQQDETAQLEKLKALGINSFDELKEEISKLNNEINTELEKYATIIGGE